MLASWAGTDVCPVDEAVENQELGGGQTEVTPLPAADLAPEIQGENLQPAPDYDAMTPAEEAVVEIVGRAIADEEYRETLLADARAAIAGYPVTEDDQFALDVMPEESFAFFASEVEARLGEDMADLLDGALSEEQQETLQHIVHAVWRDLNPGGLAYVLAYKIPNKHLK